MNKSKEESKLSRDSIDNRGGMIYTSGGSNFIPKQKVETHICPHCFKNFDEVRFVDLNWNL